MGTILSEVSGFQIILAAGISAKIATDGYHIVLLDFILIANVDKFDYKSDNDITNKH